MRKIEEIREIKSKTNYLLIQLEFLKEIINESLMFNSIEEFREYLKLMSKGGDIEFSSAMNKMESLK